MMKRILKPGRNCIEVRRVERSAMLADGRDYYRLFQYSAKKAKKYIAIAGWQFDSEVRLLRGMDADGPEGNLGFLNFLDHLCETKLDLKVYILAWDFSVVFSLEREWMQDMIFNWSTSSRLNFYFDSSHAIGASQHQKFVIIDGALGFVGGMDICAGRWDDRTHLLYNPDRLNPDGRTYDPYHETHSYVKGPIVKDLADIFTARWKNATGQDLKLPSPEKGDYLPDGEDIGVRLRAARAALSRTQAQTLITVPTPIKEVRALYIDAIDAAQKLIYIENQYLSSYAIYNALLDRMREKKRPKLEIVIVLPKEVQAFVEGISMWNFQSKLLKSLKKIALENGHAFGVYYSAVPLGGGEEVQVYIHSKLIIVDDRFISIGSANTTNRSMGLDTELNVSWEATSFRNYKLIRSIKEARSSLLAEHMGLLPAASSGEFKKLLRIKGLVKYLNSASDETNCRLKRHGLEGYLKEEVLRTFRLEDLSLDPGSAVIEENVYEVIVPNITRFTGGITSLKDWLLNRAAKKTKGNGK